MIMNQYKMRTKITIIAPDILYRLSHLLVILVVVVIKYAII